MTALARKVRRSVPGGRRGYVIILSPHANPDNDGLAQGALIEVREKGRRSGYTVTVGGLYTMLAVRAADLARARPRRKKS